MNNFWQAGKRVFLFIAVNALIMLTLSIVVRGLGLWFRIPPGSLQSLMLFCLVWGMAGSFISLALSRVLAKWLQGVQVIDPGTSDPELRQLVETVHALAQRAGLPAMPEVGIYDSPEVNAFATGPTKSRSLVAVSTGLLRNMRQNEVQGVLGHEVAHIANGDMVTMTLLQGIINAFVLFLAHILSYVVAQAMRSRDDDRGPNWLVQNLVYYLLYFVFSLLGSIVICAFSRWREFRADAGGAQFAGRGSMISALTALQEVQGHPEGCWRFFPRTLRWRSG